MTPSDPRYCQQTTPQHLMRLLSRPDSMLTKTFDKYSPSQTDCLLAGLAMFQGDVNKAEVRHSIQSTNMKLPYGYVLLYSGLIVDVCFPFQSIPYSIL